MINMNKEVLINLHKDIGESRFNHTLRVVEESKKLAKIHNIDIDKAVTSALLHDCAKFEDKKKLLNMAYDFDIMKNNIMKLNNHLIHAPLGAILAKYRYNILDKDILNAIKYHTTGRKNMSTLEKLTYIADYIEPARKFDGIEIVRQLAYQDLDRSILLAMNKSLVFLINNDRIISRDTFEARNQLIINIYFKEEMNEWSRKKAFYNYRCNRW